MLSMWDIIVALTNTHVYMGVSSAQERRGE